VRSMIRENKMAQIPGAMQTGRRHGMQLLEDHMNELITQKLIKVEDAIAKSNNPDMIKNPGAPAPQPAGAR